ncbi:hypothetical protein ACRASX_14710 [Flavobacterium sp. TMP13]|uniref:hypothetical protein n=1 Tax=Flavobacterium sp. TMP13 TaxID=3425950 RepID=UPI003D778C20
MKIITIIIEKNEDGFWAYAKNEKGIVGGGGTLKNCKQDILDCIDTLKELSGENKFMYSEAEYILAYNFDTNN